MAASKVRANGENQSSDRRKLHDQLEWRLQLIVGQEVREWLC